MKPCKRSPRRRVAGTLAAILAASLVACQADEKPDGTVQKSALPVPSANAARSEALEALKAKARSKQQPGTPAPTSTPALAPTPALASSPEPATTTALGVETPACAGQYQEIRGVYDSLPKKFYNADQSLQGRIDAAIVSCRGYLAECRAVPRRTAEVQAIYGKFLYTMSAVRKREWQDALASQYKGPELAGQIVAMTRNYMGQVVRLTEEATKALPREDPLRAPALMVLGQAATQAKTHDRAIQAYNAYVNDYNDEKNLQDRARAVAGLAAAYRESGQYDAGIALLEGSLQELYKTKTYPYLVDGLYKLYLAKGDPAGMLQASNTILTVLPLKLQGGAFSGRERDQAESLVIYHGFRKAYAQFAMGDLEEARHSFDQHVASIDARKAELSKAGRELPPAWKIYRERSSANLTFLGERAGQPAPSDLDLGSSWVSKGAPLSESRGHVIALVFRRVGDDRSTPFLEDLNQVCAADPRFQMRNISFIRNEDTIAQEFEEMRQELSALGYEGAAGFDPDFANKSLFRSFQAMVGSATFLVVDGAGNLVWFQQDPRAQDVNFAKTILTRVAEGG